MAKNIIPINCTNCVFGGDCRNITAIDCSSMKFTAAHNDKTFIRNALVTPSNVINAVSGYTLDGITYGYTVDGLNKFYLCDDTLGDIPFTFGDPAKLKGCEIYFKRIKSGGHNIKLNAYLSEKFEFAVLPQTIIPLLGNTIKVTSNGTDWVIVADYTLPIIDTTAIDAANARIEVLEDLVNRLLINNATVGIDMEDGVLLDQLNTALEITEI